MILTYKAKADFIKWCKQDAAWMDTYDDLFLFALIIDWLDSVGIYIEVGYLIDYKDWYRKVSTKTGSCYIRGWETRQEATKAAIEKANELYNGQGKH